MISPDEYLLHRSKSVEGWLDRVDAEIILATLGYQRRENLGGGAVEIGLHHGKLFIALCLSLTDDEKAYGVDIFDDQGLNLDASGLGSRAAVERNMAAHGVDNGRVTLDGRSSEAVSADDILPVVGRVKFFSVDGGHWRDIVLNDLRLAQKTIADHGVIAVDDFHRPDWPDVSAGVFDWIREAPEIAPFAIGSNKLYLCRADFCDAYRNVMRENAFLPLFLRKEYEFLGASVPVYHCHPLGEATLRQQAGDFLKLYYPNAYFRLRKLFGGRA